MITDRLRGVLDLVRGQSTTTPGGYVAIGVARGSGILASAAFLDGQRLEAPIRSAIASLTKPITATAIMQLVEAGGVELDAPVATYVPEFTPQPPPGVTTMPAVTVRHVLSHTSGLTDVPDDQLARLPPSPAAMLAAMAEAQLRFVPGSAFQYCSESFYLLSAIVERISGIGYADALHRHILQPLGMEATSFDPTDPVVPSLPPEGGFPVGDLSTDERARILTSLVMPGGGLWSTPDDVLRFGRAMLLGGELEGSRVLDARSVAQTVEEQTVGLLDVGSGQPVHYGLGWGLQPGMGASDRAFAHSGATGSILVVDPGHDLVIMHLRNWWEVSMELTTQAVAAVYAALAG